MKKHSFIFGAVILTISGILCKILGAIYKIPLTNILGSQGMGIYYLIFPVFAFLLSFTSNSFTVSISKRVSSFVANKDYSLAYKCFKASIILLSFLGGFASLFLICFSKLIAVLQGVEVAFVCYIVIAPAVISVSISSAFKGLFQGLQNMVPTAVSQIVGQVIKLSLGFTLAKVLSSLGFVYGALGALCGLSIAEILTTLFFVIYFFIFKHKNKKYFLASSNIVINKKEKSFLWGEIKKIFVEAIPFTLNSVILPLSLVIDSFLIINILKKLGIDGGVSTSLLGLNSGVVNTLVGLPSTVSSSLCLTIIPFISFALSKKNFTAITEKSVLVIKLCFFIAIPCVFIFGFFSTPILKVLYSASFGSFYELNLASTLLSISAINVFYLSILQITTALLQAVNKSYIPVISLTIALAFKVICEVVLISNPYINIAGAVISNGVCYFISCIINFYYIKKYINLKFSFYQTIGCPVVVSLLMVLIVFILLKIFTISLGSMLSVILAFGGGFVFYLLSVFYLKGFTAEELSLFFRLKKKKQVETK